MQDSVTNSLKTCDKVIYKGNACHLPLNNSDRVKPHRIIISTAQTPMSLSLLARIAAELPFNTTNMSGMCQ